MSQRRLGYSGVVPPLPLSKSDACCLIGNPTSALVMTRHIIGACQKPPLCGPRLKTRGIAKANADWPPKTTLQFRYVCVFFRDMLSWMPGNDDQVGGQLTMMGGPSLSIRLENNGCTHRLFCSRIDQQEQTAGQSSWGVGGRLTLPRLSPCRIYGRPVGFSYYCAPTF